MLSNSSRGRAVRRGAVVAVLVLVWLGIGGLGGTSMGKLSEVQQNDAASFLPQGAESTRAAEAARAFRSETTLPAIVVMEGSGALTPEQLARAQAFAAAVPALALPDGRTVQDVLLAPTVAIPSQDGQAVLVAVSLDARAASEQVDGDRVTNLVVAQLRSAASELDSAGLTTWVTGPAGAIADLVEAFGGIDGLLLLVALLVVFVILVLVYRSPSLPFAVLGTAIFGLSAAALAVYELAKHGVLVLNGQSQGILFILVVGAATDYSLLIVARYREELRRVQSPYTAMGRALRASLPPVAASAGTVIAALLCLLLSDLSSNSSLGPVAAIGIGGAFLAATTLLPALLLIAGRRSRLVFWPRVPRAGLSAEDGHAEDAVAPHDTLEEVETRSGLWGRVASLIGRHPRRVWGVTAVALLVAAAWVPTLRAQGTSESDIFLTDVESVAGETVLADHFDAGQVQPITVVVAEGDAAAALAAVQGVPGVLSAAALTDTGGAPSGAPVDPSAPPLVVDGRVEIDVVTEAGSQTQEAVDVVQGVRDAVHPVSAGALVGGPAAERLDTNLTSERDLRVIVPAVLLVILVVLMLLLRSVVAAVLIVVANLLSFAATLGIGALVFNHVLGFPGADPSVPLYAFVFLVALGIDYSIFLMTRVREEALVHGTREGVRRGLAVTGGVITSAGIVLAATFGALAVLPLLFLVQLAFLVALGVLIDTLVVRTLLVPGLVHDLGRASWWPWQTRMQD
ncbi:MAG TPA: MMPL family transporter [Actinotalea sp.]